MYDPLLVSKGAVDRSEPNLSPATDIPTIPCDGLPVPKVSQLQVCPTGIRRFQCVKLLQEQFNSRLRRFQSLDLTRTRSQVVTCSATNVNWQRYRAVQQSLFCYWR